MFPEPFYVINRNFIAEEILILQGFSVLYAYKKDLEGFTLQGLVFYVVGE